MTQENNEPENLRREVANLKNLRSTYLQLMKEGKCPICKYKVDKHSKIKLKVCQGILLTKINFKPMQIDLEDKKYNVLTSIKKNVN